MPTNRIFKNIPAAATQRGVVLLLVLIVLVAMTLAGISMMRSVDTGNVIAGNMAFKQTTIHSGDRGISDGYAALINLSATNKVALTTTGSFPGYFAVPFNQCEVFNTCAQSWWAQDINWVGAPTVTVLDASNRTVATVSYLVHRMCSAANLGPNDSGNTCQTYEDSSSAPGGDKSVGAVVFTNTSVFYRITARSVGPRNTVAYSQTLVLLPE